MTFWGKLAGAAAGLAVGGPLGALFGALAGHYALDRGSGDTAANKQITFTMGVIALGAKIAKADGVVTRDEVSAFREVFQVPESEIRGVARLFDLAKQSVDGYDSYAKQLARLFADDPEMLRNILDALCYIARADHVLHPAERRYLAEVGRIFGISDSEFSYILSSHVPEEKPSPYNVLGVSPDIADEDLRRHYRKLMTENHPDKLVARGVPPEMIAFATHKIATLNAAYDEIRKARGL